MKVLIENTSDPNSYLTENVEYSQQSFNDLIKSNQEKDQKIIELYDQIMIKHKEIIDLNKKIENKNVQLLDMLNVSHTKDVKIAVLENKFVERSKRLIKRIIKKIYRVIFKKEKLITEHKKIQKYTMHKYPESKNGLLNVYNSIKIPKSENILVSIVIPVYNCSSFTIGCLKSIEKTCNNMPIEILIADDNSTDSTKYLNDNGAIRIIRNSSNLRFLKNCNNAAKHANGKYIVFLNNDTIVTENWLQSLVELIESDDSIGMVGSKFIYPNGKLQEAGGILWRDGSAWNYGNGQDSSKSEFNYVKEADYISGASILLRTDLWKALGGFDENFAPAYYEDTDLAFSVRKAGYKVMYQPKSVVVHFEGASNGTDTNSGQKSYQVINAKKFYEKWKDVLFEENFQNGENLILAKDRSKRKKRMLVIDHYVPNFDKDAGGKCTYFYTKLFTKLGMKVTFIGDNFACPQPYTNVFQQMGVEVLYGTQYQNSIMTWLTQNAHYFDYVYLNRPHISEKYIDVIKCNSEAKIIYFGHDLHSLREMRQYEISKDPVLLRSAQKWKIIEDRLFNLSDVIYVVGSYEQKILSSQYSDKPIRNIPVYFYDEVPSESIKDFDFRKDLLFVGGFNHKPNIDAVLWFAQNIFPKILVKYPKLKWYVVGSNPPKEVLNLASSNIIVTGFISDEELTNMYKKCKIVVVPLRYGAGVKGKVVEAAYNLLPIVTTSIGAEGLSLSEGALNVADSEEEIEKAICDLYENNVELEKMSQNCKQFIINHFTEKTALDIVLQDIVL